MPTPFARAKSLFCPPSKTTNCLQKVPTPLLQLVKGGIFLPPSKKMGRNSATQHFQRQGHHVKLQNQIPEGQRAPICKIISLCLPNHCQVLWKICLQLWRKDQSLRLQAFFSFRARDLNIGKLRIYNTLAVFPAMFPDLPRQHQTC